MDLQGAAARTPSQGDALGEALVLTLGQDYDEALHIVGHSLGARVNRQAVDMVHLNGFDWARTHVTILDAAELGDLDARSWEKSIPDQAAWIDNYVSAFGDIHPEATNVILRAGMPISLDPSALSLFDAVKEFHEYPVDWYSDTIDRPLDSDMGYRWTFEGGGLDGSPSPGSMYVQTLDPFDDHLALDRITWDEAETIIIGRDVLYGAQYGLLTLNMIRDGAVQTVGNVLTEVVDRFQNNAIEWTLRLILEENSPSYAWVPITVPSAADMMSFDFMFEGVGDDDFLSAGIGDDLLFAIEGRYITANELFDSGWLDVSAYSGQEIELFFGLNSDGVAGGIMTIEGIEFMTLADGDFDNDGDVDADDIDALFAKLSSGDGLYDLTGDGVIDQADVDVWVQELAIIGANHGTILADFNLDGAVDAGDLALLGGSFGVAGDWGWATGDANGDGMIDAGDLALLGANFGTIVHPIPEPMTVSLLTLGGLAMLRNRRR